jgi:hypothetical protein
MGSFRWICDQLAIEPSWIRRQMMTVIRSDQVAKERIGSFSAARLQSVFNGADEYTLQCASDLLSA